MVTRCKRCGREMSTTPSGHLRAHHCPHGKWCQVPYDKRRTGQKREHCAACVGALQTKLFE